MGDDAPVWAIFSFTVSRNLEWLGIYAVQDLPRTRRYLELIAQNAQYTDFRVLRVLDIRSCRCGPGSRSWHTSEDGS
jgi:hypothetical protein